MSKAPLFNVLENTATNAGEALSSVLAGATAAAKKAAPMLIAKDEGGLLQYIPLIGGKVPITDEAAYVNLKGSGDNAGSTSFQTLFDITLQASMVYKNLSALIACFRETTFEILWIDDVGGTPVETILATGKVGAGAYSENISGKYEFTSGAVGTQVLRVRAANQTATSTMEASATIDEVQ